VHDIGALEKQEDVPKTDDNAKYCEFMGCMHCGVC
jgi:hypothetical protein